MVHVGDGFELSLAVPGRALRAHAACADMLAPGPPSRLRGHSRSTAALLSSLQLSERMYEMSGNCKIVKGLSLLGIVYGIVQIVVGAICFFGAADVAGMVGIDDPVITAQVLGVVLAVSGVFLIVTGFVGARGANRPSKLMPFIVLATIFTFVNLFGLAMIITGGSGAVWPNLLQAAVGLSAVLAASRAQKEAMER